MRPWPPKAPVARSPRPLQPELTALLSDSNARLASARRLTSRRGRRDAGLFLAEGAQSVREAAAAGAVDELFATAEAIERHAELLHGRDYSEISVKAAASLSETVTPQGLIAVCRLGQPTVAQVLELAPKLLLVLVEPNDPGNLGAVIRTADAAGADAVFLDGGVDPYNGKTVRASAGSLFHLPVIESPVADLLAQTRALGVRSLATTGRGNADLDQLQDDETLAGPVLWLFGNEAHGLPEPVMRLADQLVRVPLYGQAESLNLAATAAVCLYASARAHRH